AAQAQGGAKKAEEFGTPVCDEHQAVRATVKNEIAVANAGVLKTTTIVEHSGPTSRHQPGSQRDAHFYAAGGDIPGTPENSNIAVGGREPGVGRADIAAARPRERRCWCVGISLADRAGSAPRCVDRGVGLRMACLRFFGLLGVGLRNGGLLVGGVLIAGVGES